MIDALGRSTNWYNNQGLLVAVSNAVGQVSQTVYDLEDRPASVTDANGVTVTQTFDALDRVLTRTYPDTGVEKFAYSEGAEGSVNSIDNCAHLHASGVSLDTEMKSTILLLTPVPWWTARTR